MSGMQGVTRDDFFKKLHAKGRQITFDHRGKPIVQKHQRELFLLQKSPIFHLNRKVIVENSRPKPVISDKYRKKVQNFPLKKQEIENDSELKRQHSD